MTNRLIKVGLIILGVIFVPYFLGMIPIVHWNEEMPYWARGMVYIYAAWFIYMSLIRVLIEITKDAFKDLINYIKNGN